MSNGTAIRDRSIFVVAMLLNLAVLGGHSFVTGQLVAPPSIHDDPIDYDSLGWELSQGRGFQIHYLDSEFAEAYGDPSLAEQAKAARFDQPWPTATRPPLFPAVLAVGNKLFGRQFWFGRIVNLLAMAGACGLLVSTARQMGGNWAAVLAWLQFTIIDVRCRMIARALLTEALAVLVVAVFIHFAWRWAALALKKRNSSLTKNDMTPSASPRRWLILAATTMGFGLLLRTAFVVWMPVLLLMFAYVQGIRRKVSYFTCAMFVIICVTIFSPWAIRNCTVLQALRPLGTLGPTDASAAYSDKAFREFGQWNSLRKAGFFDEVERGKTGLKAELARGDLSVATAKVWVRENWYKIPPLAMMRIGSELVPRNLTDLYMIVFALIGWLAWRKTIQGSISAWVIAACLFGIAITWSTAGRFMIPVLYPIHLFAALGASEAWRNAIVNAKTDSNL